MTTTTANGAVAGARTTDGEAAGGSGIAATILATARQRGEGAVLNAKMFLHLASRAAIDQALSRLARRGELLRVGRGLYVLPVVGRFRSRAPTTAATLQALAAQSGERLVAGGAAAANRLGLTTQVPARTVVWTSGRDRTLALGRQRIELRHAPDWQLALGEGRAGAALRALVWLGRDHLEPALARLEAVLTAAEREELAAARGALPDWLAAPLGRLADG